MATRTFMLTVHDEGDHYWAEVADLPGCFASGRDLAELKEALAEAIGLYLDRAVALGEFEPADQIQQLRTRAELLPA